jgi:hypothetical protein
MAWAVKAIKKMQYQANSQDATHLPVTSARNSRSRRTGHSSILCQQIFI